MALHGLMAITLGVPEVEPVRSFYEEFGLRSTGAGMATADGGVQLRLVPRPWRQLVEVVIGADDADDIARVRAAAAARDLPMADTLRKPKSKPLKPTLLDDDAASTAA